MKVLLENEGTDGAKPQLLSGSPPASLSTPGFLLL